MYVIIVVIVLQYNCHVSDHPNTGPVASHIRMDVTARIAASGEPAQSVRKRAADWNTVNYQLFTYVEFILSLVLEHSVAI